MPTIKCSCGLEFTVVRSGEVDCPDCGAHLEWVSTTLSERPIEGGEGDE